MKIFNTRLNTVSNTQKIQLAEQYQADDYLLLDFDTRQHSRFQSQLLSQVRRSVLICRVLAS